LSARHSVHVFALNQEQRPARWTLRGAHIHNIGSAHALVRAVGELRREHRVAPFDVLHALWAGASSLTAAIAARLLGIPLCVHLTGGELVGFEDIGYGQRLRAHWRVLNHWVLTHAACVSATSEPIVQLAAAIGIDARRVPLGVARNDWPPLAPRPREAGETARLIQVASLNRVKEVGITLEALHRLIARGRRLVVDFVGEDTLCGEVQAHCARLGLTGQATFHGFLTQRELRPVMERAHLHIVSSRHEAGPAAVLEAAFVGVPTVGTRVGHISEWSGQAALAVPVRDAEALARAIELLLGDDAERLRLAREAQRRALAEDADHTAAQFEAMYYEVTVR